MEIQAAKEYILNIPDIQTLHKFQNKWIKICFATGFQQRKFNYDLYDKTTNGRIHFSKWAMAGPLQKAGM